jgi:acyl dehydratase
MRPRQGTGGIALSATYDELNPGHEFPPVDFVLGEDVVGAYVEAVGAQARGHVPPLAVAARAIASLGRLVTLSAGTIHASQEFEFYRLVPVGARVTCAAKVVRKLSRGPVRMLTLETLITDESSAPVQKGRSTIVLPES